MAFNARAPNSQYRPQDSIPFLDTTGTAAPSARATSVAYPAELTAWRTSIVAPPLVYEGPWSASAIGLDFCSNLDEMRAAKERALGSVWPFMPDKSLSFKLVRAYFDEVRSLSRSFFLPRVEPDLQQLTSWCVCTQIDWLHMVLHRESFEAEHERAWDMLEAGRGNEIDPMWLACYFMVRRTVPSRPRRCSQSRRSSQEY